MSNYEDIIVMGLKFIGGRLSWGAAQPSNQEEFDWCIETTKLADIGINSIQELRDKTESGYVKVTVSKTTKEFGGFTTISEITDLNLISLAEIKVEIAKTIPEIETLDEGATEEEISIYDDAVANRLTHIDNSAQIIQDNFTANSAIRCSFWR